MINNIIISLLVLYGGSTALEGGYQAFYEAFAAYVSGQAYTLVLYGVAGSIAIVLLSLIFRGLGWYAVMYILSKCFFWLSQFCVTLLSVAAVIFWLDFQKNLWWDLGVMAGSIPFLVLVASGYSLKQFDFNYPIARAFEASLALPILSVVIIFTVAYFSG